MTQEAVHRQCENQMLSELLLWAERAWEQCSTEDPSIAPHVATDPVPLGASGGAVEQCR